MMNAEHNISREYCDARSGGIERVQRMAERRLDTHGQKLDDLTRACIQLTAAVDRVTLILEKQDLRLDQVENKKPLAFLDSAGGKMLLRLAGVVILILLCAGVGINVFQILKEVL
ncbi:MAG: hypothetical protein IJ407_01765 [Clostridia bacterium]|nr:hypothetical protein [Clostridia bacterium]